MIIPNKAIKDIIKIINENIQYNKLPVIEQNKFISKILSINCGNDINLNPHQIIYIRDTYILLLSKTKGTEAHKIGDKILLDYKNKVPILNIANKYELPPMAIVYQILIEKKYESHVIAKMINKRKLSKTILNQFNEIIPYDPAIWYPYNIPNIYPKINRLNCTYQIKYDFQKLGKHPDILFLNPCTYKHKTFSWIITKPYILFDCKLHLHDIQKNINNFSKYGVGLILYNEIICSNSFLKKIHAYVETYNFLC